jgi:hypothetical protein
MTSLRATFARKRPPNAAAPSWRNASGNAKSSDRATDPSAHAERLSLPATQAEPLL